MRNKRRHAIARALKHDLSEYRDPIYKKHIRRGARRAAKAANTIRAAWLRYWIGVQRTKIKQLEQLNVLYVRKISTMQRHLDSAKNDTAQAVAVKELDARLHGFLQLTGEKYYGGIFLRTEDLNGELLAIYKAISDLSDIPPRIWRNFCEAQRRMDLLLSV